MQKIRATIEDRGAQEAGEGYPRTEAGRDPGKASAQTTAQC